MNTVRRIIKARVEIQAATMASINLAVLFELLSLTEQQLAGINVALGLWFVVGHRLFVADLNTLADDATDRALRELLGNGEPPTFPAAPEV